MEALQNLTEVPESMPFELTLTDGSTAQITDDMVTRRSEEITLHGEWFTPHVIEPAFGIDRIIWHILDHCYTETEKEGEKYSIMSLSTSVSPFDVAILPLFDKDGMGDLASEILLRVNSMPGLRGEMDSSKSIGRRYARIDEIGVPWAITVDHETLENGSVTIRRRDDQMQVRATVDDVVSNLAAGTVSSLF